MQTVSNTEIVDYLTCRRKHYYRHELDYDPVTLTLPLNVGILGHKALEEAYRAIKDGALRDDAKEIALDVVNSEMLVIDPSDFTLMKAYANLHKVLTEYFHYFPKDDFEVLEVEKVYTMPLTSQVAIGCKIDALVQMTSGPYYKDKVVLDWKFVYNFKTSAEIDMDAQIPRYVKILRSNGIYVTKGMFFQLRYRELKNPGLNDLFAKAWVTPTAVEIATIWEEQEVTALDIVNKRQPVIRNMNLTVCRNCSFRGPCKADLQGQSTDLMLRANFKKSDYGYVHSDGLEGDA